MRRFEILFGLCTTMALSACGGEGNASSASDATSEAGDSEGETGECPAGERGCECLANEACEPGLECVEDLCVPEAGSGYCGDGNLDEGEECDLGASVNSNEGACTLGCRLAECGDGLLASWEACDDGNLSDEDSCTSECALPTCGDGIVQLPEACDDGNDQNGDACLDTCVEATCGDGFTQVGVEECDPQNPDESANCDEACALLVPDTCGDGVVDPGEFCHELAGSMVVGPAPVAVFLEDLSGDGLADVTVVGESAWVSAWQVSSDGDVFGPFLHQFLSLVGGADNPVLDAELAPAGVGPARLLVMRGDHLHVLHGSGDDSLWATPQTPFWPSQDYAYATPEFTTFGDSVWVRGAQGGPFVWAATNGGTQTTIDETQWVIGEVAQNGSRESGSMLTPGGRAAWLVSARPEGDETSTLLAASAEGSHAWIFDGSGVETDAMPNVPTPGIIRELELPPGLHPGPGWVGDLNDDGAPDVLVPRSVCAPDWPVSDCPDGRVFVSRTDADAEDGAQASINVLVGKHPMRVAAADVDADGISDIITADGSSGSLTVRLGDAGQQYRRIRTIELPPSQTRIDLSLGDINGDGIPDFAAVADQTNTLYLVLSNP